MQSIQRQGIPVLMNALQFELKLMMAFEIESECEHLHDVICLEIQSNGCIYNDFMVTVE